MVIELITWIRKEIPGRQTLKRLAQDAYSFPADPHPLISQGGYSEKGAEIQEWGKGGPFLFGLVSRGAARRECKQRAKMSSRKERSQAGAGSPNFGTRLQAPGSGPEALRRALCPGRMGPGVGEVGVEGRKDDSQQDVGILLAEDGDGARG